MRIIHVLLTSRFAGTERYVVDLATAQAAQGHDVSVVLRRKAAQSRPDAIASRFGSSVDVHLVNDWLFRWPAVPQAKAYVEGRVPDIVHAHLSSACRAVARIDVCPRVSTLHISFKPKHHAKLDGLIAIAPWQVKDVPAALQSRVAQIDNWTIPKCPAPSAREKLRNAYNIDPGQFLIGALGRVEDSKGMDLLVEAFERAKLPGAKLVIVGQGKAWQKIRSLSNPSVIMPGFAERPEDWLAAFDCFVSPARQEPFGLVLLEAMQAGLPIVATASEGAKHLAQAIRRPLVPIGDVEALATSLQEVYATRMGRVSYDLRRFCIEDKVLEVENFYRETLSRWSRRS